jgi:uncharacterized protein YaeQ
VALQATVFNFEIDLSDVDRSVYEKLSLSVARHPSETTAFMLTRVLAFCLEYKEGLSFSRGLAATEEPAVWSRDPTGTLTSWIEVGSPSAERLHRARKACEHVAIYCHRDLKNFLREARSASIHKADTIAVYAIPQNVLEDFDRALDKRNVLSLSRSEDSIYLEGPRLSTSGVLERHAIGVLD